MLQSLFFLLFSLSFCSICRSTLLSRSDLSLPVNELLLKGSALHRNNDLSSAREYYDRVLALDPSNVDALQLMGLVLHATGDTRRGIDFVESAIDRLQDEVPSSPSSLPPSSDHASRIASLLSNLGELYRSVGDYERSLLTLQRATTLNPSSPLAHYNYGQLLMSLGRNLPAVEAFDSVLRLDPSNYGALYDIANILYSVGDFESSAQYSHRASEVRPESVEALMLLATSLQRVGDHRRSTDIYNDILRANPDHLHARLNLGSIYHAEGDMGAAISLYEHCRTLAESIGDRSTLSAILNNLGAAQLISDRPADAHQTFIDAMLLDDTVSHLLINLGSLYNDEGEMQRSDELFTKALQVIKMKENRLDLGLVVRKAIGIPPVPEGTESSEAVYQRFTTLVAEAALTAYSQVIENSRISDPVIAVEKIHFYLVYMNRRDDRQTQQLVAQMYAACSVTSSLFSVAPHLSTAATQTFGGGGYILSSFSDPANAAVIPHYSSLSNNRSARRKLRVGFISKFFGDFEPHGLLLEGIIKHLPRKLFRVVLLPIVSPSRRAAPYLTAFSDELYTVPLSFEKAKEVLFSAKLDVLVFGDMNSEPMTHFLGYTRFAPIQALFWGNPITSGNPSIDYFISADRMEYPFRTQLPAHLEPYSEQVVILDGQGIWYSKFEDLKRDFYTNRKDGSSLLSAGEKFSKADFGLTFDDSRSFYLCAQNVFKLHPDFDYAIKRILELDPNGVVVLMKGKHPKWTEVFTTRLRSYIDRDELWSRVYFVDRVSSVEFANLVRLADVMLHPFPFDGSRTSLDGLMEGVPCVTFPQSYLRGRMAVSYFASMDVWDCCVANSAKQYVQKAVRMGTDAAYRNESSRIIAERLDRVWNDKQVVWEWARWLQTAAGVKKEYQVTKADCTTLNDIDNVWQSDAYYARTMVKMQQDEKLRIVGGDRSEWSPYERYLSTTSKVFNDNGMLTQSYDLLRLLSYEFPDDARIRNDLGAVLQQLNRLEESVVESTKAIEMNPNYGVAMNNLGVALKSMKKGDESLFWFMKGYEVAIALDDDYVAGLCINNAANVLRDRGDVAGAISLLCGVLLSQDTDVCQPENASVLRTVLILAHVEDREHHKAAINNLWGEDSGMYDLIQKVKYGYKAAVGDGAVDILDNDRRAAAVVKERMSIVNSLKMFMGWLNQIEGSDIANILRQVAQIEGVDGGWGYQRCLNSSTRTNLVVQFFNNKRRSSLTKTAILALVANVLNPCISKVWVLYETHADKDMLVESLGRSLTRHELDSKVNHVMLGRRMTFSDAFAFANDHIGEDELVILSNDDIVFGHTLSYLFEDDGGTAVAAEVGGRDAGFLKKELFALSRWSSPFFVAGSDVPRWSHDERHYRDIAALLLEEPQNGRDTVFDKTIFQSRIDSQDTWIFKGRIPDTVVSLTHFYQGLPRCDQRIASIFRDSGYVVSNPSVAIVGTQIENSGIFDTKGDEKGKDNKQGIEYDTTKNVHGKYENVLISDSWDWKKKRGKTR